MGMGMGKPIAELTVDTSAHIRGVSAHIGACATRAILKTAPFHIQSVGRRNLTPMDARSGRACQRRGTDAAWSDFSQASLKRTRGHRQPWQNARDAASTLPIATGADTITV
eukprot:TRINITY_DN69715_c0_g1_i1.p5 TRINITY_DN69715_c0_g1~~TRINITY_DN69715_c0_g1_i1.p5  ORF type:complete len:111 (+),score=12.03 TRINITY_DN69715_c0_g1_i1:2-334(+)